MKASALSLLVLVLTPFVALAQGPADLNTITRVEVRGSSVVITGTKKPNFTTFTMTDPARLVIDISEAVFSGVPEELPVSGGTVTGIRTASYGSEATAIARVLIGFSREVETDFQAEGTTLVVKVLGDAGAAVAQAPAVQEPKAQQAPATQAAQPQQQTAAQPQQPAQQPAAVAAADAGTATDATAAARAERDAQAKAAAQAAAAAKADREAQEKAAAQAAAAAKAEREAQDKAAAEARKREEAARVAQAEQQKQTEAEKQKQAAAQEKAAQAAAQKQAEAEKQKLAQAEAEKQKSAQAAEAEAKREAAAQSKREADERRAAEAEAKKQAAAEAQAQKAAEAEAKKAAQAEARAARAAEAQAAREAAAQRKAEARAAREAKAAAEPEQGDEAAPSARSGRGRNTMTFVGFKQEASSSRVFVRTSGPVRYTVTEGGQGTLILELENTRIALSNNTRALDTSFFDTAVAAVDPAAGPSRTVRIAIRLKSQVPYQARQEGNEVSLEFPRPSRP